VFVRITVHYLAAPGHYFNYSNSNRPSPRIQYNIHIHIHIIIIITVLYISESINVFIYLVTYRPVGPGAFCVFVYVIVYNYVNVCTRHNNKPFTYLFIQR